MLVTWVPVPGSGCKPRLRRKLVMIVVCTLAFQCPSGSPPVGGAAQEARRGWPAISFWTSNFARVAAWAAEQQLSRWSASAFASAAACLRVSFVALQNRNQHGLKHLRLAVPSESW
eukprot:scaffold24723_cov62-Phaeocystis_antarctica.AAC.2